MPGENQTPPSLREIAEAAYDDLEAGAAAETSGGEDQPAPQESPEGEGPSPDAATNSLAEDAQPRDKSGRWVAKAAQPGEAVSPQDPAPKPKVTETQAPTPPDPAAAAQAARSNQAPEHWSAEDKATFSKLPKEGQAFLLKRHGEMEAEFTRKSQASAGAVQFTHALTPVFGDAQIQALLKRDGLAPAAAIQDWGRIYRMGNSERQEDKFSVLVELTQRMGLDPARIFLALQNQPPSGVQGLDPEAMKDPTVKFIADNLGRIERDNAALRAELRQQQERENKAREEQGINSARTSIDSFADEKDASGRPLRPHFDTVLPTIIDLFKANPNRDLNEAYGTACWAHPEIRKQLLAAEHQRVQAAQDLQKARQAVRTNARGITSPAARPPSPEGPSKGGLRDAIERSAEDIGF